MAPIDVCSVPGLHRGASEGDGNGTRKDGIMLRYGIEGIFGIVELVSISNKLLSNMNYDSEYVPIYPGSPHPLVPGIFIRDVITN